MALFLKIFVVLLLIPALAFATHGPTGPPWKTFSEMATDSTGGTMAMCHPGIGGEVVVGRAEKNGEVWTMWYSPATNRVLFGEYDKSGAATPIRLWMGEVDPKANDVIPPLKHRPFSAQIDTSPCTVLFPNQT